MDKLFKIEFERGGFFQGKLLETEAPTTCQKFWEVLPFEGRIVHAAFTGLTMFFPVDFKVGKVENPYVCGGQAGDFFLNSYATPMVFEGRIPRDEIIIPYSRAGLFWKWGGWLPSNLFGKIIESDLEGLYRVGRRVKEGGSEVIRLSKV